MEDEVIEFKELLRNEHPKRRNLNKLFRNRRIWKGAGGIAKVILAENQPKEDTVDPTGIYSAFENDGTGMTVNTIYSLKKKKRYMLPEIIGNNLPEFDDHDFPLPLQSVSLHQMYRHKAENSGPACCFNFPLQNDLRQAGGFKRSIIAKKADGSVAAHNGRFSSESQFLKGEEKSQKRRLHFQYQVLHYEDIPGMHNSHKHECSCCRCSSWNHNPPEMELFRLGKEIPRCSSDLELYLKANYYSFSNKLYTSRRRRCHHIPQEPKQYQETYNLGEIPIKVEKRRVKDWVIV